MRTRTLKMTHLIVRRDSVLCTNCFQTEPVTCGDGTPMDTLIIAYQLMAKRHEDCVPLKAGERRRPEVRYVRNP